MDKMYQVQGFFTPTADWMTPGVMAASGAVPLGEAEAVMAERIARPSSAGGTWSDLRVVELGASAEPIAEDSRPPHQFFTEPLDDPWYLTADERAVLWKMDEGWCNGYAYSFSAFDMPRDRARAACRSLAAKGLATFERGLVHEDGTMAGSGYGITRAGHNLASAIAVMFWSPWCECRAWPREPLWRDPRDVLAA